jgi:hypothetical protein
MLENYLINYLISYLITLFQVDRLDSVEQQLNCGDELKIKWRKGIVVCFKILQNFPGRNKETLETFQLC